MLQFVIDRHEAFEAAIMYDDWDKAKAYCKKYQVTMPESVDVFKAGVYKGAQYCTDLSDAVKKKAREKCAALGFSPYIG